MYDFIVPQELNIKDKLAGFTFAQWGFIATGFLIFMFMLLSNLPLLVTILFGVPSMALFFFIGVFKRYDMPIYEFAFVYLQFKVLPKEMIYSSENKIEFDFDDDEEVGDIIFV